MRLSSSLTTDRVHHPSWLLWLVALPAGMVLNGLTGGLDHLPQALLTLMDWLHEPTRLQRLAAALVSSMLIPAVLIFLLLRFTPVGAWLAPNRLALAGLMLANALILVIVVNGIYQASIDMPPYLHGLARDIIHPAATGAMALGLGVLAAASLWYRWIRDNERARDLGRRWLREYQR